MDGLSYEIVFQIVIQAVSNTAVIVTVRCNQRFFEEKLTNLENKQDKHNSLIERMAIVEQSCKSAHHRINENTARIDTLIEGHNESNTVKRAGNRSGFGED